MVDLITLEKAVVARRGAQLLGPLSGRFGATGATAIIGPNGAGKTTLLRLLHGLERAHRGHVTWARPCRQSFVFQAPIMLRRTTLANLMLPLQLVRDARAEEKAAAAAKAFGLDPHLDQNAAALSGGERQKLALARALLTDPEVVFLDEPTASLDGAATRIIEAQLQAAKAAGTRILFASHSLGQVRRLADHVVFLYGGGMTAEMPTQAFFSRAPSPEAADFIAGNIVG